MSLDRPTDFVITRATLTDLHELVEMFEAYRQFYGRERCDAQSRQFLEQRLALGDSTILIARVGGRVAAGFVQLYPCFSSLSVSFVWILNDLYVKPEFRGAGLGRALMEAARQMGQETGASRLLLATALDNHAARSLYESLGYSIEPAMMHYSLELSPLGQ